MAIKLVTAQQIETLTTENEALRAKFEEARALLEETVPAMQRALQEIELLKAVIADKEARLEKARALYSVMSAEIAALKAPRQISRAPKADSFAGQVTWTGVSRNGNLCRRIGKGDSSWLEDQVNGQWVRRGTQRRDPVPPLTDEDYARYAA